MKTVKLNLIDRLSWQKFQHVLTSFASDYIDLVAPEQTLFQLDQKILRLSFALIGNHCDHDKANAFTRALETFLARLPLVEVERVELELIDLSNDEVVLTTGFNLAYIAETSAITKSAKSLTKKILPQRRLANLVGRAKTWITSPKVKQNIQTASNLAIRNPKTFLAATGNLAKENLITAVNWVDRFPWENWAKNQVAQQKRRHERNLFKAIAEDLILLALMIFITITAVDFLSAPSLNLASLPNQHYDRVLANPNSRCGWAGLNRKNYVCLTRGMTYREVVSILGGEGKPLGFDKKFGEKAVIVSWSKGDGTMNVTFNQDSLVAKAYRNLPS